MVGVEQWAEMQADASGRRVVDPGDQSPDGVGIARRSRGCWRRRSRRGTQREPAGSKLDPFKDWICEQLAADPRIQSQRLREMAVELGYQGGKSIFDDFVREVRPRFLAAADVPADDLSAGRAGPVRSVGAERADPGRAWAAASWLGGDVRGVLVACDRRRADLQQGGAGHPVGPRAESVAVGGVAGEAGLGPRVGDRCWRPPDRGVRRVLRSA